MPAVSVPPLGERSRRTLASVTFALAVDENELSLSVPVTEDMDTAPEAVAVTLTVLPDVVAVIAPLFSWPSTALYEPMTVALTVGVPVNSKSTVACARTGELVLTNIRSADLAVVFPRDR
jgi:hypothetical protein